MLVDVWIVLVMYVDLCDVMEEGCFCVDLFYCLCVMCID